MKKRAIYIVFTIICLSLFVPKKANALQVIKSCNYKDSNYDVSININNDYTAVAHANNLNLEIKNWKDIEEEIKNSDIIQCPKYTIVTKENLYVSNNNETASFYATNNSGTVLVENKGIQMKLATNTANFKCDYAGNLNGRKVSLTYRAMNGIITMAFTDGTDVTANQTAWYHSQSFSSEFLKAATASNDTFVCPTITLEKNQNKVTVYPKLINDAKCNGACGSLKGNISQTINTPKTSTVVSTCAGPSFAPYNDSNYYLTYFRTLSDGSREWSIDGANYIDVKSSYKIGSGTVSLDKTLISKLFSSGLSCPTNVYRCTDGTASNYTYELTTEEKKCSKNSLGNGDGQATGSTTFLGLQNGNGNGSGNSNGQQQGTTAGTLDCTGAQNSIFGDPEDEESVAWLMQKILTYIKIAGPFLLLIFTSIDYLKALITSDDDSMAKTHKKLIIRIVLALLLFFIPTLVNAVLDLFDFSTSQTCEIK